MTKLLIGCVVVLFIFLAILALGLVQTANRVDTLERRIDQEMDKVADDFLQEDDFYPCLDEVYRHLEDVWRRLEYLEE